MFDLDSATGQDDKALRALCDRIRARFKVSVLPNTSSDDGEASIVVAALGRTEERLSRLLDHICDACEESGFGRIESETTLLDHIDNLGDS